MDITVGITGDTELVVAGQPARVKWMNIINTGTESVVGSVIIEDQGGNALHTIRVGVRLDVPLNWNYFRYFGSGPREGLRSTNGLQINVVSATNIQVEIEYD